MKEMPGRSGVDSPYFGLCFQGESYRLVVMALVAQPDVDRPLDNRGQVGKAPSCAASGGATPSTRPGEPRVAGPGLGGRAGTRRRAPDH